VSLNFHFLTRKLDRCMPFPFDNLWLYALKSVQNVALTVWQRTHEGTNGQTDRQTDGRTKNGGMKIVYVLWKYCVYVFYNAEHFEHLAVMVVSRRKRRSVNQFWWNLVLNSRFGSRWQSHDQIIQFLTFNMADDRHIGKCWKCCNSPSGGPIWTFGFSHGSIYMTPLSRK